MLRLQGGQVESLWDELLPEKLRELPEGRAQIDALVRDETLMREVSDSLHRRRFCLVPIDEGVPDESTVGKLTRRLGAEVVAELSRILASAECLETLAERSEDVGEQIRKRLAGEPIEDRLVSLFDPDARPIRTGKLGKTTEFGSVEQLAAVTPNTKPGARGLIVPPASAPGNRGENELLPTTVHALQRLGLRPHEVALDGGLQTK